MKFNQVKGVTADAREEVVKWLCENYDYASHMITADWQTLVQFFLGKLAGGDAVWVRQIKAWADVNSWPAYEALNLYVDDEKMHRRWDAMPVLIQGWDMDRHKRPAPAYPKGHPTFMRDIWILTVIEVLTKEFKGMKPTRGFTSSTPSAAYFIWLALRRKGDEISEDTINQIYMRRNELEPRIEGLMPPVNR